MATSSSRKISTEEMGIVNQYLQPGFGRKMIVTTGGCYIDEKGKKSYHLVFGDTTENDISPKVGIKIKELLGADAIYCFGKLLA